jgi:hypothetical protein
MFDQCLSVGDDCDWYYICLENSDHYVTDEDVTCGECGETIEAGLPHHGYIGRRPDHLDKSDHPGQIDYHATCETCSAIWDSLAGGEQAFGQLSELLWEAYEVPLTEEPDTDTTRDYEDLCNQHDINYEEVKAAAQPLNTPGVRRMLAGLDLLEDFLTTDQILTVFEWASSVSPDSNESHGSMQDRIEYLADRVETLKLRLEAAESAGLPTPPAVQQFGWIKPSPPQLTPLNVREEIAAIDPECLMLDGFDAAAVGTVHRCGQPTLVAYSYTACVDVLVAEGLTPEEAQEHMTYNVEGGWLGERTPCVIHPLEGRRVSG